MDLASSNAMPRKALDFVSTYTITHTNPTGPAVIGITASSIGNRYYTVLYITGVDSHRSIVLISNTGARARRAAVMSAGQKRKTIKRNPDKKFAEGSRSTVRGPRQYIYIYLVQRARSPSTPGWSIGQHARARTRHARVRIPLPTMSSHFRDLYNCTLY